MLDTASLQAATTNKRPEHFGITLATPVNRAMAPMSGRVATQQTSTQHRGPPHRKQLLHKRHSQPHRCGSNCAANVYAAAASSTCCLRKLGVPSEGGIQPPPQVHSNPALKQQNTPQTRHEIPRLHSYSARLVPNKCSFCMLACLQGLPNASSHYTCEAGRQPHKMVRDCCSAIITTAACIAQNRCICCSTNSQLDAQNNQTCNCTVQHAPSRQQTML